MNFINLTKEVFYITCVKIRTKIGFVTQLALSRYILHAKCMKALVVRKDKSRTNRPREQNRKYEKKTKTVCKKYLYLKACIEL